MKLYWPCYRVKRRVSSSFDLFIPACRLLESLFLCRAFQVNITQIDGHPVCFFQLGITIKEQLGTFFFFFFLKSRVFEEKISASNEQLLKGVAIRQHFRSIGSRFIFCAFKGIIICLDCLPSQRNSHIQDDIIGQLLHMKTVDDPVCMGKTPLTTACNGAAISTLTSRTFSRLRSGFVEVHRWFYRPLCHVPLLPMLLSFLLGCYWWRSCTSQHWKEMSHQYSTHHEGCLQKEKIISLVYFSQLMIIEKVDAY